MRDLHRKVEKKEKRNVSKFVPLHPHRPSERIGVLFEWEKHYLKSIEKPFNDYKTKMEDVQKTSGVILTTVDEFRKDIKEHINDMWNVVARHNAILTQREKALAGVIKDQPIGNGKPSEQNIKLVLGAMTQLKLTGEDITSLGNRIGLFKLLPYIGTTVSEKVEADACRLFQVGVTLLVISHPFTSESMKEAVDEILTVLHAQWRKIESELSGRWAHLTVEEQEELDGYEANPAAFP
jgi:hypothetical protein